VDLTAADLNTEKVPNSENNEKIKQTFSYWACFFFGPYYLAYKGYLKEGLCFGLFLSFILLLVVDYGIQPNEKYIEKILNSVITSGLNFFVAWNWENYIEHKSIQPNKRNRFVNVSLTFLSVVAMFFIFSIIEIKVFESRLESAKVLEKSGEGFKAFEAYQLLCFKDLGEACFYAGLYLAKSNMHERASIYWRKGCINDYGEACNELGLYLINKEEKESQRFIHKACDLGFEEACQK
jgi:hypothetical protein